MARELGVYPVQRPADKLDPLDRIICGIMAEMKLWPQAEIAKVFGISQKTVSKHRLRHGKRASHDTSS